jgi:hypothetical protein
MYFGRLSSPSKSVTFSSLLDHIYIVFFRINSWNLVHQRMLRHRFWLSTRRKREKQQNRENVLFISRNVILLFLPHHFISLFSRIPYARNTISAYVNFISFIWTLKRSSLRDPKYETHSTCAILQDDNNSTINFNSFSEFPFHLFVSTLVVFSDNVFNSVDVGNL